MPTSGAFSDPSEVAFHAPIHRQARGSSGLPSRFSFALAAFVALAPASVFAGPCTAEIDRLQAQADAAIDATAGSGSMGRESTGALLHHQPTPGSVARAEEALGEGSAGERTLAALARAREADAAGDAASCERELSAARQAMSR
jgi:hypothetical protein